MNELGAGVVEGGEPDFVDEDEGVAEQGFDHFPTLLSYRGPAGWPSSNGVRISDRQ